MSLEALQSYELLVFPSRRALTQYHSAKEGICAPSMVLGEFFSKAIIYPNKSIVPKHLRKFIVSRVLREYDKQHHILLHNGFVFEQSFIAYLQSSEFFLRFFDELFVHKIAISEIPLLDTYGEYEDHLRILQDVYERYCAFLEQRGWVYKSWDFTLAHLWLQDFSRITIMLCGVLSPFELAILREVSRVCLVHIRFDVWEKTQGFWDIFDLPLDLDCGFSYVLSYPSGELVAKTPLDSAHTLHAYSFLSRIEQVGAIRQQISEWLARGIEPEEISIVLPQEDFTQYLQVLDTERNCNYAMGKPLQHTTLYATLSQALRENTQSLSVCVAQSFATLNAQDRIHYAPIKQKLDEIVHEYQTMHAFFDDVDFGEIAQSFLHEIKGLSIDDVYGGRIRVIGALESRGVMLPYVILVDCNDGVIPHFRDNDLFLNTALRLKLGIPTTYDKEKLQVLYYKNLLLGAKEAVALCVQDDKNAPAHLLQELGCVVHESEQSIFQHTLTQSPAYKREHYVGRLRKVFSPTSFTTFVRCKLQYCFRYVVELREENIEGSNAASVGILVHSALQKVYEPYIHKIVNLADIDLVQKACEQYVRAQEFEQALDRANVEILLLDLARFFEFEREHIKQHGAFEILGLEEELEDFVLEGYRFCGARVDRIQRQSNGEVFVIDYKYTNNISDIAKEDFALELYANALSAKYGNIKAMYYDLKNAKSISSPSKKEELIAILHTIDTRFCAREVSSDEVLIQSTKHTLDFLHYTQGYGVFSPADTSKPCLYCAYKTICDR
ncbi:PD-(D/E)XK nuclease family protein [uncultured Helicobacter sp.]|uniref:PD-(D/E)XK nuclease family protein n=1 Tax=uncultured Helicobacter sp. TaxID=175537 RepID=UPI00374F334C